MEDLIRDQISSTAEHDDSDLANSSQSLDGADLGLDLEHLEDRVELVVEEPW